MERLLKLVSFRLCACNNIEPEKGFSCKLVLRVLLNFVESFGFFETGEITNILCAFLRVIPE